MSIGAVFGCDAIYLSCPGSLFFCDVNKDIFLISLLIPSLKFVVTWVGKRALSLMIVGHPCLLNKKNCRNSW